MKVTAEAEIFAGENAVFGDHVADGLRGTLTPEGALILFAKRTAPDRITLTVEFETEGVITTEGVLDILAAEENDTDEETVDILAGDTQEPVATVYVGNDLSALTGGSDFSDNGWSTERR